MIVDMRLRPPIPEWTDKAQFRKGVEFYPTRVGFPRPPSAEERSIPLLLQEMDEAGIRWGVVMGRQSAEPMGVIPNDAIAKFVAEHSDRFVAFAGIDISRDTEWCIQEIDRCMKLPGFKGVSIEPGASTTPMLCDDERLYPIYERCNHHDVPISVGLSNYLCYFANAPLEYANPIPLYQAARDFPELDFIVSHAAWPWVRELLGVAFVTWNVIVSPDLYFVGTNIPGADEYIKAANMYLSDRTLFGTAYPSRPLPESVEAFDAWEFEAGVKEKILYKNALRVMKMDESG